MKRRAGRRGKYSGLSAEQDEFCRLYALNGGNSVEARRQAYPGSEAKDSTLRGYAAKALKSRAIQDRIAHYRAIIRTEADREFAVRSHDVLRGIAQIAFLDPRKLMRWGQDSDGEPYLELFNSDDLDPEAVAAVAGVECKNVEGQAVVTLALGSKIQALTLLAKHLGLIENKRTVESAPASSGTIRLVVASN